MPRTNRKSKSTTPRVFRERKVNDPKDIGVIMELLEVAVSTSQSLKNTLKYKELPDRKYEIWDTLKWDIKSIGMRLKIVEGDFEKLDTCLTEKRPFETKVKQIRKKLTRMLASVKKLKVEATFDEGERDVIRDCQSVERFFANLRRLFERMKEKNENYRKGGKSEDREEKNDDDGEDDGNEEGDDDGDAENDGDDDDKEEGELDEEEEHDDRGMDASEDLMEISSDDEEEDEGSKPGPSGYNEFNSASSRSREPEDRRHSPVMHRAHPLPEYYDDFVNATDKKSPEEIDAISRGGGSLSRPIPPQHSNTTSLSPIHSGSQPVDSQEASRRDDEDNRDGEDNDEEDSGDEDESKKGGRSDSEDDEDEDGRSHGKGSSGSSGNGGGNGDDDIGDRGDSDGEDRSHGEGRSDGGDKRVVNDGGNRVGRDGVVGREPSKFDSAENNRRFLVMGLLSVPHDETLDDQLYEVSGIERDHAPNNFVIESTEMEIKIYEGLRRHHQRSKTLLKRNKVPPSGCLTYTVQSQKSEFELFKTLAKEKAEQSPSVPTFKPKNKKDLEKIWELLPKLPFIKVTNIREVTGMKYEEFGVKALCEIAGGRKIEVLQQLSQKIAENWNPTENPRTTFAPITDVSSTLFAKNYIAQIEFFKKGWERLAKSFSKETLEELEKELWDLQLPSPNKKLTKFREEGRFLLTTFGTNFDVDPANFPKVYAEIVKLITAWHPDNKDSLLKFIKKILPGINQAQFYFKAPGCRTSAHIETVSLYSLNLNCGPGRCYWIGVATEYAGHMDKYIEEETGGVYGAKFWPDLEKLKQKKIPYFTFYQEPNEMVLVGLMAYHWVQTESYTTNLSWNIAPQTVEQFDAILEMCDHALIRGARRFFPVKTMILNLLREWTPPSGRTIALSNSIVHAAERIKKHEANIAKLVEKKRGDSEIKPWKTSEDGPVVEICDICQEELFGSFVRGQSQDRRKKEKVSVCIYCIQQVDDPEFFAIESTIAADLNNFLTTSAEKKRTAKRKSDIKTKKRRSTKKKYDKEDSAEEVSEDYEESDEYE